jgi:hypothetical protein
MEEDKSGVEDILVGFEGDTNYTFEIERQEERIC